jgi:hypothetical protein
MTNRITAYLSDWPDNPFRGEVIEAYERQDYLDHRVRMAESWISIYVEWPSHTGWEGAEEAIQMCEDLHINPGVIATLRTRLGPEPEESR